MGWRELLHLQVKDWGIDLHVGSVLVGVLVTLLLALELVRRATGRWRVTKVNFKFAGWGQVEISPDDEVAKIAHNAWIELSSRKATIPFDPDNDVIAEIYNSWYELFRALRDLARSIPPGAVHANSDAALLAEVLLNALNRGLRPHLTRWQARFRRWYETNLANPEFVSMTPQEVQRQYPDYEELLSDLERVSIGMMEFTEELRRLAHERRRPWQLPWGRTARHQ